MLSFKELCERRVQKIRSDELAIKIGLRAARISSRRAPKNIIYDPKYHPALVRPATDAWAAIHKEQRRPSYFDRAFPLDVIYPTQENTLFSADKAPSKFKDMAPIPIIKFHGKFFSMDKHHLIMGKRLTGYKTHPAYVWDADNPLPPPRNERMARIVIRRRALAPAWKAALHETIDSDLPPRSPVKTSPITKRYWERILRKIKADPAELKLRIRREQERRNKIRKDSTYYPLYHHEEVSLKGHHRIFGKSKKEMRKWIEHERNKREKTWEAKKRVSYPDEA